MSSSSAAVPGHFQLGEGSSELGLAQNTSLVSGRSLLSPRPCTVSSSARLLGLTASLASPVGAAQGRSLAKEVVYSPCWCSRKFCVLS